MIAALNPIIGQDRVRSGIIKTSDPEPTLNQPYICIDQHLQFLAAMALIDSN